MCAAGESTVLAIVTHEFAHYLPVYGTVYKLIRDKRTHDCLVTTCGCAQLSILGMSVIVTTSLIPRPV